MNGFNRKERAGIRAMEYTMGSFFSGSGGFELAGHLTGVKVLWASEIEPFPIIVTQTRFPSCKHLGDISRLDGTKLEPVDIVTGGSPCQDMSVAGGRAGLKGSRSVLFMEYIRVVKEMRKKHGKPRYMVWENVPGAFSSNGGRDFQCVLGGIAGIAEDGISVPEPAGGKWKPAGAVLGNGWSLAWRVLDAQYWGVPQRRKRIWLVADFDGSTAGEILFKRKGLRWDTAPRRKEREETSRKAAPGTGKPVGGDREIYLIENHAQDCHTGITENNIVPALTSRMGTGGNNVPLLMKHTAYGICALESNSMKSANPHSGFYEAGTSRTIDCRGGNPCCNQGGMVVVGEEPVYAIQGNMIGRSDGNGPQGAGISDGISFTLTALDRHAVACQVFPDKSGTLSSKMCKGTGGPAGDECQNIISVDYAVRRLTPLECGRLQGFPDGWTDGLGAEEPGREETRFWQDVWAEWWALIGRDKGIKRPKDEKAVKRWLKNPVSDTALYKMWGNGIALPCALYVFEGITEALKRS